MENASKALLIAGSILIAIIIISVLVKNYSSLTAFQKTKLSQEEQEQLITFNEQYIKYLGQYVYGTEVTTLQNKYVDDKEVEVVLDGEQPIQKNDGDDFNQTRYYKCTNIGYDNSTGRVNKIYFKQIKISSKIEP